ncbi:hypothetical protein IQ215_04045 [Cyanobacterium stanieri LEGE 03274]|uniref:Uncharacterized protein n=1 Tax=Cyanobacterium stanieri LEGE 03274 TaxID=1828756 RepID=A0ABR9V1U1_9CHRO|nr:hypothetical protein [Cyanobacterium stanieri]MBE9221861.1 hypothetical protein [Cyanobacterium stanieri LEGE 03274]
MKNNNPEENPNKFWLSLYLMPVIGLIFALISVLSSSEYKTTQIKKISRLSLKLGGGWLIIYSSLWLGSVLSNDLFSLRLMYLNGMLTTGYFLLCLFFLLKLWASKKE